MDEADEGEEAAEVDDTAEGEELRCDDDAFWLEGTGSELRELAADVELELCIFWPELVLELERALDPELMLDPELLLDAKVVLDTNDDETTDADADDATEDTDPLAEDALLALTLAEEETALEKMLLDTDEDKGEDELLGCADDRELALCGNDSDSDADGIELAELGSDSELDGGP